MRLSTEFITLAALLKLAGITGSGGEAKQLIQHELVSLNGVVDSRRGAKVRPGDVVTVQSSPPATITVRAEPDTSSAESADGA